MLLALPRWLPKPPLSDIAPSSRSITAAGGELLRLTLASDEQYRLWTPLDDIALPPVLTLGLDEYVTHLTLHTVPASSHWIVHEQPELLADLLQQYLLSNK